MNIPDAEEARKRIEEGNYEKALIQADQIAKIITDAITKGQKSVSTPHIELSIKNILIQKGYDVKYYSSIRGEESYWVISWI